MKQIIKYVGGSLLLLLCGLFSIILLYPVMEDVEYFYLSKLNNKGIQNEIFDVNEEWKKEYLEVLYESERMELESGVSYGKLQCFGLDINLPVTYGEHEEILERGIGQLENGRRLGINNGVTLLTQNSELIVKLSRAVIGDIFYFHTEDTTYQFTINQIKLVEGTELVSQELTPENYEMLLSFPSPYQVTEEQQSFRFDIYFTRGKGKE